MEAQANVLDNAYDRAIDYFVFTAKDYLLALPYHEIIQIIDVPPCTAVPNMPKYLRGVINVRGESVPLIDTRTKLSLPSRREEVNEFVSTFMKRKQDHLNWVDTLKKEVDNNEEITVEEDPHKCAFGRWYDTYKANSLTLATYIRRFDRPHKVIHGLAVQAEKLIRTGQKEQAKEMIHSAENNELVELVKLFDGFEEQMRQSYQEYAVIVDHQGQKFSLTVDSIKYFEKMDEIVNDAHLFTSVDDKVIHGIGRKKIGDASEDIIIVNLEGFLDL
jgi:chemotaxis signal transduction protein